MGRLRALLVQFYKWALGNVNNFRLKPFEKMQIAFDKKSFVKLPWPKHCLTIFFFCKKFWDFFFIKKKSLTFARDDEGLWPPALAGEPDLAPAAITRGRATAGKPDLISTAVARPKATRPEVAQPKCCRLDSCDLKQPRQPFAVQIRCRWPPSPNSFVQRRWIVRTRGKYMIIKKIR